MLKCIKEDKNIFNENINSCEHSVYKERSWNINREKQKFLFKKGKDRIKGRALSFTKY